MASLAEQYQGDLTTAQQALKDFEAGREEYITSRLPRDAKGAISDPLGSARPAIEKLYLDERGQLQKRIDDLTNQVRQATAAENPKATTRTESQAALDKAAADRDEAAANLANKQAGNVGQSTPAQLMTAQADLARVRAEIEKNGTLATLEADKQRYQQAHDKVVELQNEQLRQETERHNRATEAESAKANRVSAGSGILKEGLSTISGLATKMPAGSTAAGDAFAALLGAIPSLVSQMGGDPNDPRQVQAATAAVGLAQKTGDLPGAIQATTATLTGGGGNTSGAPVTAPGPQNLPGPTAYQPPRSFVAPSANPNPPFGDWS